MSNLTRNDGHPQLRCRVTRDGLRYEIKILGRWTETNHSFVEWSVGNFNQGRMRA